MTHVTEATACSPPWAWRTRCGWTFYGANVVFLGLDARVTCAKCAVLLEGSRFAKGLGEARL